MRRGSRRGASHASNAVRDVLINFARVVEPFDYVAPLLVAIARARRRLGREDGIFGNGMTTNSRPGTKSSSHSFLVVLQLTKGGIYAYFTASGRTGHSQLSG